jgi:hypothetical protein
VDLIRGAARAVNPAARGRDHKAVSPARDRAASLVLPARTRAELAQATTHAPALRRRTTRTPVRSVRVERTNRARGPEAAHRALDGCLQQGTALPTGFPALSSENWLLKWPAGNQCSTSLTSVTDREPLTRQSPEQVPRALRLPDGGHVFIAHAAADHLWLDRSNITMATYSQPWVAGAGSDSQAVSTGPSPGELPRTSLRIADASNTTLKHERLITVYCFVIPDVPVQLRLSIRDTHIHNPIYRFLLQVRWRCHGWSLTYVTHGHVATPSGQQPFCSSRWLRLAVPPDAFEYA